jgi:hypothetical protein
MRGFDELMEGSPLHVWDLMSQSAADREDKGTMIPGLKDVKADVLCTRGRQDMICCW